jgi:hypothetical protein
VDATATHNEFRFSTDDLPPSERLPYLREVVGRYAGVDLGLAGERPLKWAARMHLLDGLAVVSGEISGLSARRHRSLLADCHDELVLTTHRSGFSLCSQLGRECRADGGSAVLLSHTEPGAQHFPGSANYLILRIPPRRLAGLVDGTPEDSLARRMIRSVSARTVIAGGCSLVCRVTLRRGSRRGSA